VAAFAVALVRLVAAQTHHTGTIALLLSSD